LQRVDGRRIADVAFLDLEYFFYGRILQETGYAATGVDPFEATKTAATEQALRRLDPGVLAAGTQQKIMNAIFANASDYSQVSIVDKFEYVKQADIATALAAAGRIHLVLDNCGYELVSDLVLALDLARSDHSVKVHAKTIPLFVSDATVDDIGRTLTAMKDLAPWFHVELRRMQAEGRIEFAGNALASTPEDFRHIGASLGYREEDVVLLKGDLNYRRAIGDAVTPIDQPLDRLAILPDCDLYAMRSVKSYCLAGVDFASWPERISRGIFPMDGTICMTQRVPARAETAA